MLYVISCALQRRCNAWSHALQLCRAVQDVCTHMYCVVTQARCTPLAARSSGVQVLEELEVLGSDCARVITRLRARLAPERQVALDGAAAALSPAFDLQAAPGRGPVA